MTLRLALFGHPVAQSKSPPIHAAFAAAVGVAIRFELIDVPDLDFAGALARFRAAGGAGANVTLPFKETAVALCDALAPRARAAGAVNTLAWRGDALHGDNTDGAGLVADLVRNHGVELRGARVLVCGAGGAARGAVVALLERGATVSVANRTPARLEGLAQAFPAVTTSSYAALRGAFDAVINATSASLAGEALPLGAESLRDAVCYDMFYADRPTPFVAQARAAGARLALDGWGMLVEQAAESFAVWTGARPATAALLRR